MNDADRDMILAVTDGLLTGHDRARALEHIAADTELSEELAAQMSAKEALASLAFAPMTPSERASLRDALITKLHLEAPAPSLPPRARPWWQKPAVAVASIAMLLLAIAIVPNMLSASSEDSSALVAADAPVATTAAASEAPPGADTSTNTMEAAPSELILPTVDAADVDEFLAPAPSSLPDASLPDAAGSRNDLLTEENDTEPTERLTTSPVTVVDRAVLEDCLSRLAGSLPPGNHQPVAATQTNTGVVVHFGVDVGAHIEHSISIDLDTCTIVAPLP